MAKKTEYKYEQRFFNEGTYNADKLLERLEKATLKIFANFQPWVMVLQKEAYERAKNGDTQPYWTDILVKGYSDCLWNQVYNSKGKTKKAEKAADLAVEQFERNFK